MDWRQRVFLGCCLLQITVGNMSFALISPFFPLEAPRMGLDRDAVALVFGCQPLAMLFASPLAGPLATSFGRRRVLSVGAALLAVGGTCFGLGSILELGRRAWQGGRGP